MQSGFMPGHMECSRIRGRLLDDINYKAKDVQVMYIKDL